MSNKTFLTYKKQLSSQLKLCYDSQDKETSTTTLIQNGEGKIVDLRSRLLSIIVFLRLYFHQAPAN